MRIKLILFLILFFKIVFCYSGAKALDSTIINKKNAIYLLPSAIGGDLWADMNNVWIELGYNRFINNKHILGVRIGNIVYSKKTNQSILNEIDSKKSTGFNLNIEHKIMIRRKIYYSSNVFFQQTKTFREEELNLGTPTYYNNQYYVLRNVYGIIPKIGFLFINRNGFFTDIGIGFGIRFITSKSFNKIDINKNLGKEELSRKIFDIGNKITPRIVLQIKLGYAF